MDPVLLTADADRFTANAYLVEGATTAMIDVGTPDWVVDAIEHRVDHLDAIYLTHSHADHTEQLGAVVDRFDPAVYAFDAVPQRSHPLSDGDEVPLGDTTASVLHTPGHAADHVVLFTDRWLFSGDIVVYNDGAFDDGSFGRTDIPGADREVLIESIERMVEAVPPTVDGLYPGHGDSYEGDVHAVIERSLERASRREPKYSD